MVKKAEFYKEVRHEMQGVKVIYVKVVYLMTKKPGTVPRNELTDCPILGMTGF